MVQDTGFVDRCSRNEEAREPQDTEADDLGNGVAVVYAADTVDQHIQEENDMVIHDHREPIGIRPPMEPRMR